VVDCIDKDSEGQRSADVRNATAFAPESHYYCRYCDYGSEKVGLTRDHVMKKHLNYWPYSCSFCDFRATKSISVMLHVRHKHPTATRLNCSYLRHLNPEMEIKLKSGYYSSSSNELATSDLCMLQDHTYNAASSLAKTITATNDLQQNTDSVESSDGNPAQKNTEIQKLHTDSGSENFYQCPQCTYEASGSRALKVHISKKHRKPGLMCPYCDVLRRGSSDMFVHWYKSHKDLPFKYQHIGGKEPATSDVSAAPAGVQTTLTVMSEFDDNLSHDPVTGIPSSQAATNTSALTHEIAHAMPYGQVNDVIYCCEICPSSFSTPEALSSHECTSMSSELRVLLS